MLPFIFLCGIATFICLLLVIVSWNFWVSRYTFLNQPTSIPWLGSTFSFVGEPHLLAKKFLGWTVKYNHLYLVWFGPFPFIVASRVEYAEAVLRSQTLIKRSRLYHFFHEWLGTGLITSDGRKWKSRRKGITPTFHYAILNTFSNIFDEQAQTLVTKLRACVEGGEAVDVQIPISLAKLDVICETAMGVRVNAQDSPTSPYVTSIHAMNSYICRRMRNPWLWATCIYNLTSDGKAYYRCLNVLHNFTINVIKKRIKSRHEDRVNGKETFIEGTGNSETASKKRKMVFLDMLLNLYDAGEIDMESVREEVDTFMVAGHGSTSAALSWILYKLGKHPEIQDRLYDDIKLADSGLPIVDKVKGVKYLECVIKEGLRLHPPAAFYGRVTEVDTVINNHVIPKGTEIAIFSYALHRNPMYWDNPDEFIPDRFADAMFLKGNPYCYVPFSAGSRNCIGQRFAMLEEKIFLYHLVLNYKWVSVQKEEDVKSTFEVAHRSESGLLLEFSERKDSDW